MANKPNFTGAFVTKTDEAVLIEQDGFLITFSFGTEKSDVNGKVLSLVLPPPKSTNATARQNMSFDNGYDLLTVVQGFGPNLEFASVIYTLTLFN